MPTYEVLPRFLSDYEFRFAGDGRALFMYGTSPHPGDVHIVWLRVGTHDIYTNPSAE